MYTLRTCVPGEEGEERVDDYEYAKFFGYAVCFCRDAGSRGRSHGLR